MTCFTHGGVEAVGICTMCQKAVCRDCVAADTPRLVCRDCAMRGAAPGSGWRGPYAYGYEYKSAVTIGAWPLVHVCTGIDPLTMRPRIAKGVIAIGNIAVGGLAVGGLAAGVLSVGGAALGLLCAIGGAALGLGVSVGGLAVGSVAVGGLALGFVYAIGGAAFGPGVIDGMRCDPAAREFARRWLSALPPSCR